MKSKQIQASGANRWLRHICCVTICQLLRQLGLCLTWVGGYKPQECPLIPRRQWYACSWAVHINTLHSRWCSMAVSCRVCVGLSLFSCVLIQEQSDKGLLPWRVGWGQVASSGTDVRYYTWGGVHLCKHTLNMWSYCGMIWEQTCHVEPCVHKKDNLEKPESLNTG